MAGFERLNRHALALRRAGGQPLFLGLQIPHDQLDRLVAIKRAGVEEVEDARSALPELNRRGKSRPPPRRSPRPRRCSHPRRRDARPRSRCRSALKGPAWRRAGRCWPRHSFCSMQPHGVFARVGHAGAGQYIVELIEQHAAPALGELFRVIGDVNGLRGKGVQRFGLAQQALAIAIALLDAGLRGTAAGEERIELMIDDRESASSPARRCQRTP